MDLVPGLVSDYAVVRDPEFNLAYWNLHAHRLHWDGRGYSVDGRPLAFFHFSGFVPDEPELLSRHQTRIDTVGPPGPRPHLPRVRGRPGRPRPRADAARSRTATAGLPTARRGTR